MRKINFRKVYVEISNSCNLKCTFCPQSSLKRPTKFMEPELFEKIVQQVQPFTNLLCLHVMGEPLYHPQLNDFLNICQKLQQNVSIVTNGVLLNETVQDSLLNSSVKQINFSLQSFENNFEGMDNKSYLDKIFKFTKKALQIRSDIHIIYRLWNGDSFASVLEKNVSTISKIREAFQLEENFLENFPQNGNQLINNLYLNLADNFEWPTLELPHRGEQGTCRALINQLAILSDGTVVPCCFDCEGVIKLGDANHEKIIDILNSPRAMAMFNGFKNQKLVEELCQHCSYAERFS